jgi:hypothetical protein
MADIGMKPVAFLSYAHLDDQNVLQELSFFHDRLQCELSMHIGSPVHIFFDKKSIGWGKRWAEFIHRGLETAAFLIPILTPAFFESKQCREEYLIFSSTEKKLGRRDLVLPIYYVKSFEMEKKRDSDEVVKDILERQFRDWRTLRHRQKDDSELLRTFAELASTISDVYFEIVQLASLNQPDRAKKLRVAVQTVSFITQILERRIDYDSIIAYSVEMWPHLPVSPRWTRELLNDLNRDRYVIIRDIDQEVKYAAEKVAEYANEHPETFQNSTDFITKTLIFVDSEFRGKHNISELTRNAALRAGITRY